MRCIETSDKLHALVVSFLLLVKISNWGVQPTFSFVPTPKFYYPLNHCYQSSNNDFPKSRATCCSYRCNSKSYYPINTRLHDSLDVSDEGSGSSTLKTTLNLLRKSANIFSRWDDDPDLDEDDIDRQIREEEEEEEEERKLEREHRRKNGDKRDKHQHTQASSPLSVFNKTTIINTNNGGNTNSTRNATEIFDFELQRKFQVFDRRAKRTRIILLKKIALWAFDICATASSSPKTRQQQSREEVTNKDSKSKENEKEKKKAGKINRRKHYRVDRDAFYSGVLLVHLELAKYVGVAACHPASRSQIDELFELADQDRSGLLDETEFTNAVMVACAPLTTRIATYWSLLAILPTLVGSTAGVLAKLMRQHVNRMPSSWYQRTLTMLEWTVEQSLSILFFSIMVPYIFSRIDRSARRRALARARRRNKKISPVLGWLPRLPATYDGNWDAYKSGDEIFENVGNWTERLQQFLPFTSESNYEYESKSDAQEKKEKLPTITTIQRRWMRPWTFFAPQR